MISMVVRGKKLTLDNGEWSGEDDGSVRLATLITWFTDKSGDYEVDREMARFAAVANALRPSSVDLSQHEPVHSADGVIY